MCSKKNCVFQTRDTQRCVWMIAAIGIAWETHVWETETHWESLRRETETHCTERLNRLRDSTERLSDCSALCLRDWETLVHCSRVSQSHSSALCLRDWETQSPERLYWETERLYVTLSLTERGTVICVRDRVTYTQSPERLYWETERLRDRLRDSSARVRDRDTLTHGRDSVTYNMCVRGVVDPIQGTERIACMIAVFDVAWESWIWRICNE